MPSQSLSLESPSSERQIAFLREPLKRLQDERRIYVYPFVDTMKREALRSVDRKSAHFAVCKKKSPQDENKRGRRTRRDESHSLTKDRNKKKDKKKRKNLEGSGVGTSASVKALSSPEELRELEILELHLYIHTYIQYIRVYTATARWKIHRVEI